MVRAMAANSVEADKAAADFVCTVKNDEAVFNKAIETLVRGGKNFFRDGQHLRRNLWYNIRHKGKLRA